MDVRCEKCQTEYELDEAKLKPGGVTVKCTTCGHMFRVRRRGQTDVGVARAAAESGSGPSMRSGPLSAEELDFGPDGERTWLVQLDDGEIRTCRELTTLQRWIVAGMVSRTCTISRTGKKWKRLGEIPELASYFQIADEARSSRSQLAAPAAADEATRAYPPGFDVPGGASGAHPRTTPRRSSAAAPGAGAQAPNHTLKLGAVPAHEAPAGRRRGSAPARSPTGEHEVLPPQLMQPHLAERQEPSPALRAAVAEIDPRAATEISLPGAGARLAPLAWPTPGSASGPVVGPVLGPAPGSGSGPMPGSGSGPMPQAWPTGAPAAPVPPPAERSTGGWASQPMPAGGLPVGGLPVGGVPVGSHTGQSGPAYGLARGLPGSEAAFVAGGGRLPHIKGEFEDGSFVPTDRPPTDSDFELPRSRRGLGLLALLLAAGGAVAAVAYFVRDRGERSDAAAPADGGATATAASLDAAATVTPPPIAPPPTTPKLPSTASAALLGELDATLAGDRAASIADLLARLGAAGDEAPAALVGRARLESALAQQALERAALAATPAEGRTLLLAAKEAAARARGLVDRALAVEPASAAALQALADARRLGGERAVEVERTLKDAGRAGGDAGESARILAMLRLRDGRGRDARVELDKLKKAAKPGDVRATLRLALLDLAEARATEARAGLDAVTQVSADHVVAREAAARLAQTPVVEPSDPMPPEEPKRPAADDDDGDGDSDRGGGSGGGSGGSYESLLARAEKLAEGGRCAEAVPIFKQAIDARPASVEALTGLGYCHLDGRDYASAFAKFRAALGVSPRYQEAMWGIAEMYERQGANAKAVEKYREFVAEHPSSKKAEMGRRQIERLGGGASGQPTPEGGASDQPTPEGDPPTVEPTVP